MCFAVYLATDRPLRDIPTDRSNRQTYFDLLPVKHAVRKQFSLPIVYYVGSHQGCGCGFLKEGEAGQELQSCQANYAAVASAAREALAGETEAEVFASWMGDEGQCPEFTETITPEAFEHPSFQLKELHFLRFAEPDA